MKSMEVEASFGVCTEGICEGPTWLSERTLSEDGQEEQRAASEAPKAGSLGLSAYKDLGNNVWLLSTLATW